MLKLNDFQLKQLSEFSSNLSLVFIASVVTPLFGNVDKIELGRVILGLVLAVISLITSLYILRRIRK